MIDICTHLNGLNTKLQGFGKSIDTMYDNIKVFEVKLAIFKHDINSNSFKFFPLLKSRQFFHS
jgi:hypothetical protein